jgi:hypothetical protein
VTTHSKLWRFAQNEAELEAVWRMNMKVRMAFIGVSVALLVAISLGNCTGTSDSKADVISDPPHRGLLSDEWPGTGKNYRQEMYSPRRVLLGDAFPGTSGEQPR